MEDNQSISFTDETEYLAPVSAQTKPSALERLIYSTGLISTKAGAKRAMLAIIVICVVVFFFFVSTGRGKAIPAAGSFKTNAIGVPYSIPGP